MERPNHLNVGDKSATSKAGSIAIVAGIHIAVIFGLVAALNQGALMKQLQEIKATVGTLLKEENDGGENHRIKIHEMIVALPPNPNPARCGALHCR